MHQLLAEPRFTRLLTAVGVGVGSVVLAFAGPTAASATPAPLASAAPTSTATALPTDDRDGFIRHGGNQPDPAGGVSPFGIEPSPASCPTTAPAGTVMFGDRDAREVCEAAESLAPTPQAAAAIRYAFTYLGSDYSQSNRYSISPPMFDCSSLVSRAYDSANAYIRKGTATYNWGRTGGLLTYTGAYMPATYTGSNVTRVATFDDMEPGDVIIQFSGSNPANSAGNDGHAQMYIGNGMVIQSGGWHPDSDVNVDRYRNFFDNAWFFRYDAAKAQDPVARKLATFGPILGTQAAETEKLDGDVEITRYTRGLLVKSPLVGVREIHGAILMKYLEMGRDTSALGLPTSDERPTAASGGRFQYFQNGAIYWSPATGTVPVFDTMLDRYLAIGGSGSNMGLPLGSERDGAVNGTKVQDFAGGQMYYSPATGGQEVYGGILQVYKSLGAERSWLGLPTTGELAGPVDGSRVSHFQNGSLYWSPSTGIVATTGPIGTTYRTSGIGKVIGLPTAPQTAGAQPGVTVQNFQRGRIYHSAATGAQEVYGGILSTYLAMGAERSWLGLPTTGELAGPVDGSRVSHFQNGSLYWSPSTGIVATTGPIGTKYRTSGIGKVIGLPVAPQTAGSQPGVTIQNFQRGRVYHSATTGAQEVYGGILLTYAAMGAERSWLGLPVSGELAGPVAGSRVSHFQNGSLYWSPGTGIVATTGPIGAAYRNLGLAASLGLPVAAARPAALPNSTLQEFQRGRIYYSAATGAHEVYGGILGSYLALGAEKSELGLPITGETAGLLPGTRMSTFAGGTLYWTGHQGWAVTGDFDALYRGSNLAGGMGLPAGPRVAAGVPGAALQQFAAGRIYSSAATGTHEVYGAIYAAYIAAGAETSPLGLPTSGEYDTPTGRASDFQGGRIDYDGTTGAVTVTPAAAASRR